MFLLGIGALLAGRRGEKRHSRLVIPMVTSSGLLVLLYTDISLIIGDVLFVHGGLSLPTALQYPSITSLNSAYHSMQQVTITGILGSEGPLWFRGYARNRDEETCGELRKVLDILGVTYMVMGHSVQESISISCDRAVLIDTGSSYAMQSHPSSLEIIQRNGVTVSMKALYTSSEEVLFDLTAVGAQLGRVEG